MVKSTINKYEEYLATQEPINYVIISGGGAKGTAIIGVLKALESQEIIKNIKGLAGSSAGAIGTILCCAGLDTNEIEKELGKKPFLELLGSGGITAKVPFTDIVVPLGKKGEPLSNLLVESISKGMLKMFNNNPNLLAHANKRAIEISHQRNELTNLENTFLKELSKNSITTEEKEKIKQSLSRIENDLSNLVRQEKDISYIINTDGRVLHKLEKNLIDPKHPLKYKDLSLCNAMWPELYKEPFITATDKKTGKLVVYGFHTPDISIVETVRASAALPLVFKSIKVDGADKIDGGFKDNIPIDAPYHKYDKFGQKEEPFIDISNNSEAIAKAKHDRSIVLIYGNENDIGYQAVNSMKDFSKETWIEWVAFKVFKFLSGIGGKLSYHQDNKKTYETVRENSQNTVVLNTGSVGTISFKDAEAKQEHLIEESNIQTQNHLVNNDLNIKPIAGLEERTFLLKIYNSIYTKTEDKVLLEFCKEKTWQGGESRNIFKQYINLLSIADKFTGSSQIDIFLKELNNPSTSNKIKNTFLNMISPTIAPLSSKEVKEYVFTREDIEKIKSFSGKTSNNAQQKHKSQSTQHQSNKSSRRNM